MLWPDAARTCLEAFLDLGLKFQDSGFLAFGPGGLLIEQAQADIQEHAAHEELEVVGIRQPILANQGPEPESRHGAQDGGGGHRPVHPALPDEAVNPAGDGHDVEDQVGGRNRRAGEVEDAHLEGQQQESPGHPAHGGEGGDHQGDERRNERVDLHAGHGKDHNPPLV